MQLNIDIQASSVHPDFKLKQFETFSLKMLIPIILPAESMQLLSLIHVIRRHMGHILEWSYEKNILLLLT